MNNVRFLVGVREKFPSIHEIASLYSIIVFIAYGWTSVAVFWKLHSWSYILSPGEIVVTLAFIVTARLLKSVVVLLIFLFASLLLPVNWIRNKFVVRCSMILCSFTLWVVMFTMSTSTHLPDLGDILIFLAGFSLTSAFGLLLSERKSHVRRFLNLVGDQLIIFLYVSLPLSLVGILIVILRII